MIDELPQGWADAELGTVLNLVNGFAFKSSQWSNKGLPIVRIQNLNNPAAPFNRCDENLPEKVRVRTGELLFAWSGTPGTSFGAHIWNGEEAWLNQHIFRVGFDPQLFDKSFLRHAINQNLDRYIAQAHGGAGLAHITKGMFESSTLGFAPLPEQRRIATKLEKLLGQVEVCEQRLSKIPALLKRFRQAVLAAACSGRLTADWRVTHNAVRPARDIIRSLKTPDPESNQDIFERTSDSEIPETWSWVCLGKLGPLVGGGTPSTGNSTFWNGNIPWVSPKDMKRNRIRDSEDHISELALKSSSVSKIDPGAILFVVRGMILNHTLPTAITDVPVTLNQDMKALVPEIREMSEYLSLAARHVAPSILFEVKEATHGTRRIESSVLRNWAIPLPPLEEQQEIVRRVEGLFALADRIEARFAQGRKRVDRISQAILAKAFRGELVPTEAELASQEGRAYESASELLDRIRAAGVAHSNNGTSLKARKPGRK